VTDPRRLIADGLEHEKRMTVGEWSTNDYGSIHANGQDAGISSMGKRSDASGIAWLRNNAHALLTGYAAALDEAERLRQDSSDLRTAMELAQRAAERRGIRLAELEAAGVRLFDQLGANRMADEIDVLIKRRVIDSRSPAADALLDYREPPRTPRSDRLATLEAERDEWRRRAIDRGYGAKL